MSSKVLNITISAVLSAANGLLDRRVRLLLLVIIALAAFSVFAVPAQARTWYIKADGTGDGPTIQAGIDSAAAGDTVLVGPGTYTVYLSINVKSGVVLTTEEGPVNTIVEPAEPQGAGFALLSNSEVSGFWMKPSFMGNICVGYENVSVLNNIVETAHGSFGIEVVGADAATIRNNLIFGAGTALYIRSTGQQWSYFNNNIVLNNIDCVSLNLPVIGECNDVIGSGQECIFNLRSFSLDPQFCGVEGSDNHYLQSDSPCAPGNHPDGAECGLIGPLPVGCGTVSIEHKTWGAVKAIYRE